MRGRYGCGQIQAESETDIAVCIRFITSHRHVTCDAADYALDDGQERYKIESFRITSISDLPAEILIEIVSNCNTLTLAAV